MTIINMVFKLKQLYQVILLIGIFGLSDVSCECELTGGVCAKSGSGTFYFECPEKKIINIYSATLMGTKLTDCKYETANDICKAADVTLELKAKCDNKNTCSYVYSSEKFNTPQCKIVQGHYLAVAYTCNKVFQDICYTESLSQNKAILWNKNRRSKCQCTFNAGAFHLLAFSMNNHQLTQQCMDSIQITEGSNEVRSYSQYTPYEGGCTGKKPITITYDQALDTCQIGLQIKGETNLGITCTTTDAGVPVVPVTSIIKATTAKAAAESTTASAKHAGTTKPITTRKTTTFPSSSTSTTTIMPQKTPRVTPKVPVVTISTKATEKPTQPTPTQLNVETTENNEQGVVNKKSQTVSDPMIIGIAVGGGVTLLIVLIIAVVICKRNQPKKDPDNARLDTPVEDGIQTETVTSGRDIPSHYFHQYDTLNNVQDEVQNLRDSSTANGDVRHSSESKVSINGNANGHVSFAANAAYIANIDDDDDDDDDDPAYAKLPPRKYSRGAAVADIQQANSENITHSTTNLKDHLPGIEKKPEEASLSQSTTLHPLTGATSQQVGNVNMEAIYAQPDKVRNSAASSRNSAS